MTKKKIDEMIEIVEQSRLAMEPLLGFKLNYMPQTLKKLEKALIEMFPSGSIRNETAIMLGTYIGETIRRNIKTAEWKDFDKYINEACIIVAINEEGREGTMRLNPYSRLEKFLKDNTDGLYPFYVMAQDVANGRIQLGQGPQKGVSPRGYEYSFKVMHAKENPDA